MTKESRNIIYWLCSRLGINSLLFFVFSLVYVHNSYSQCNVNLNLGNDTVVACGTSLTYSAPGGMDTYDWSTGATSASITVTQPDTYSVTVSQFTGNVVNNGDFSSGNTGFTSSYIVGTGGSWGQLSNPGTYAVTSNTSLVHNNFPSCYDHTSGNATGSMMVVNGSGVAGQNVWQQNIAVTPNTDYAFEAWGMSAVASNPAQLSFSINGTQIGSTFNLSSITCNWQQFYVIWNSGANTTANISIVNQNTAGGGNDFALDDISFSTVCEFSDTVVVTPIPVQLAIDSIWMCQGDTTTLGLGVNNNSNCSQSTAQYQWSPATSLSNANVQSPLLTVQPNQSTTLYTLNYSDGCGCNTSDTLTVVVSDIAEPSATITKILCGVNDGEINVNPQGGFPSFQFSIDSGYTYQNSPTFSNLPIGYYNIRVQDSLGCESAVKLDTIIDPNSPVIDSIRIENVSCFSANNGEIEVFTTGGNSPISYSIDSGQTYHSTALFQQLNYGQYWVMALDVNGCQSIPQLVNISTNQALFFDSVQVQDLACYQDTSGSVDVFAHGGTPPLSYSIDNGVNYQSNTLFDSLQSGSYVVLIQDSFGCQTTPQVIQVNQPTNIVPQLTINNDTCYQACGGRASVSTSGGIPPYQYNWFGFGSNQISSTNLCAGNYQLQVTDNSGCYKLLSYSITEPDELVFDSISVNQISCNGVADGAITPYVSGGKPPYTYSIDGGATISTSPYFTALTAGTYDVMVYDSGASCMQSAEITLLEPSAVVLQTPFNNRQICVSKCANLSANASGGVSPYQYHWTASNTQSSSMSICPDSDSVIAVFATDSGGCVSNVEMISITLYDSLKIEAIEDQAICEDEEVQLSAAATGGNPSSGYTYNWTPINNISNPFIANPIVSPNVTTEYIVRLSDGCGSPEVYDTVRVSLLPNPNPTFDLLTPRSGCEPFRVELINTTDSIQFSRWELGSSVGYGNRFVAEDLSAGEYDLSFEVEDLNGCQSQINLSNYINVNPLPDADFRMAPNPTTEFNTTIQFANQSYGNIRSYLWDFAGQDSSFVQNPRFTFDPVSGDYPVSLVVRTDSNCIDTNTQILTIKPEFNFYIPNAFTPNGDLLNDVFKPSGIGIELTSYEFQIYDRWGKLVFATTDIDSGWDGRILDGNEDPNNGVYIWKIKLAESTISGQTHEFMGEVYLIR